MNELLKMLEEVMDLDESTLEPDTVLEELDEWDSLSKLAIMARIKKDYGKKLAVTEMAAFITAGDICNYILHK